MVEVKKRKVRGSEITTQQSIFADEVVKGLSLSDAYRKAYPRSIQWKDNSVNCKASLLMGNVKVKQRVEELKNKLEKKVLYTAEESFRKLEHIQEMALKGTIVKTTSEGIGKKRKKIIYRRTELNPALKAEELKGRLCGLYVERVRQETIGASVAINDKQKVEDVLAKLLENF